VLQALRMLPMFQQAPPDIPGVYRTLHGLEQDGTVRGRRLPPRKGPARRELSLTPAGRAALAAWQKTLLNARHEVDAVLALVQQGAKGAAAAHMRRSAAPQRDRVTRRQTPEKKRVQGSRFRQPGTGLGRQKRK
jgi:DNA-binding PadR family transcriptional regulator